jgi:hypothetical protein
MDGYLKGAISGAIGHNTFDCALWLKGFQAGVQLQPSEKWSRARWLLAR